MLALSVSEVITLVKMPALVSNAKSLKTKAILASCFILLASFVSGCTIYTGNKPAALQVTSTPEASVFLDGKHLGKTPFFSDQLKSGNHTVKISAGSASYSTNLSLNDGILTVVNRELADNFLAQSGEILWLEPGNGLFIASMPSDADIIIDGKFSGKTPHLQVTIEQGEHKVEITKDGFTDRQFTIKTGLNHQLVVNATLASKLAKEANLASSPSPTVFKQVEILKSPQGFLRVRSDSDLASREVGRVQTGDQFEIVQETDDWIQIKFEGKLGWIQKQYTKRLSQ